MNKEIKMYGNIGSYAVNSENVVTRLAELEKNGCKNLTIRMHSYGGSVFEGNVIYNAIKNSNMNIKIIIDGIAASMASVILLAANEVEICENAFIMVHRPTSPGGGDADNHLQEAKLLKDMEQQFAKCYANKTGMSIEEIKAKWLDGKDHWLNADEAISFGFASRKISAIVKDVNNLNNEVLASMKIENVFNKYAATLINNEKEMKKELIQAFNLEDVTEESPDSEVLAKLKEKFAELERKTSEDTEKNVNALLNNAMKEGKITNNMLETYQTIGKTSGIITLTNVLATLSKPTPIMQMIIPENKNTLIKDKKDWTLDDYRMHAPNELKNNPKLFDELYMKEYQNKQ